jgi:hypothetical protein
LSVYWTAIAKRYDILILIGRSGAIAQNYKIFRPIDGVEIRRSFFDDHLLPRSCKIALQHTVVWKDYAIKRAIGRYFKADLVELAHPLVIHGHIPDDSGARHML